MGQPGGSLHFTEDPGAALPQGGVLGRHFPLKIPRILILGWEELGELLGWEGGPHPGCFMRCPLKRLHEMSPQETSWATGVHKGPEHPHEMSVDDHV